MRGMHDDRHYNYWENWFKQAYKIDEFSALNTLWLTYFIAGGSIAYKQQKYGFKKILQTVYTSLPDIIGVLFLASKYPFHPGQPESHQTPVARPGYPPFFLILIIFQIFQFL